MLNLRCLYCQTPFTVGRPEMLSALITMDEKHQNHHDAHCPRCRRANSISRQRMELFFPNWREAAKQAASMTAPQPVSASTALKTEPLPRSVKVAAIKTAASRAASAAKAQPAASKRRRASKPATVKKVTPSPKKSVTTKTSKTTKPAKTSKTSKTSKTTSKKK